MKFMYAIVFNKPNDKTNFVTYTGGDTEDQAKISTVKSAVDFHNQYNKNKLTEQDITIVECKLAGDYSSVLSQLGRG